MTNFAHIKETPDGFETQSIEDHCKGVATLAEKMGDAFGGGKWAYLCGLWHDIGKCSGQFQQHIISSSGYDKSVKDPGRVDHSTAGALYAKEQLSNKSVPISYCICGHHSGLMDYIGDGRSNLRFHLSRQEQHYLEDVRSFIPKKQIMPQLSMPRFDNNSPRPKAWNLWIRMLFSCLVDADWLDTERFMSPDSYGSRGKFATLRQLKGRLDNYLKDLSANAPSTPVNILRAEVQDVCRISGAEDQGIYSLTVPTGGGKTLSSLVWAMEHALHHNLRRIIIAIPYTSIVTQTADKLREIFGQENVVEHHSYFDFDSLPDKEREIMSLATENWDAPVVVTTNVQLFESLFSNKTSRCRKLHNIAKSVLILDEVQMLPAENLHPIIDVLDSLSKYMDTSILLTTATQPAFSGTIGSGLAAFEGLHSKEIIDDVETLFEKMRRVEIDFEKSPYSIDSLASKLADYSQVLCVVNTRKEAQELYNALPDKSGAFHLSRMMCQQHISDKLAIIKDRLRDGEPVIVISTQLIEAGVDIDFPVVYREMAGLDSIAQSAGRCNREGRKQKGQVEVFSLSDSHLRGLMAKAVDAANDLLDAGDKDFLNPITAKTYFRLFYSKLNDTDKAETANLLYRPCPQFEEAANNFKMIDNSSLTLYVPYKNGEILLDRLKDGEYSSDLLRKLQRYSVNIPLGKRDDIEGIGAIKLSDYVYALPDNSNYNDDVGLVMQNKWIDDDLIL